MEHKWMKDIDWNAMKEKKISSPFLTDKNKDNFDKKYCYKTNTPIISR